MSTTRTYDVGDRPSFVATFTNAAGTLTSPSTVVFITRDPAGTETSYTSPHASIVETSTGVFTFTLPSALATEGTWYVRAKGTAGLITAGETSFMVRPSEFTTP